MSSTVNEITCSQCGSPMHLANPASRSARCEHCGAHLDLTSPEYEVLSTFHRRNLPRGLRVGLSFFWEDRSYILRGVIGYSGEGATWYECLLVSEQGDVRWLEFDSGRWSLHEPFRPSAPSDPSAQSSSLELDGTRHQILDRGTMRVSYIEGELTWKLKKDEEVYWVDCQQVGVEWTENDIEFFKRQALSDYDVVKAFGNRIRPKPVEPQQQEEASNFMNILLAVFVIMIIGMVLWVILSESRSSSQSTQYAAEATPTPEYRSSSSNSTRVFYGGGFSSGSSYSSGGNSYSSGGRSTRSSSYSGGGFSGGK